MTVIDLFLTIGVFLMDVKHGNPLQYSCLKNPMDRGARQAPAHGAAESDMTE